MTERDIIALLKKKRQYEIGLEIFRECAVDTADAELERNIHYCLIKKRLALIKHWFAYLADDEATVIRLHLSESMTWSAIAERLDKQKIEDIGCDERTLQRLQNRAIKKLYCFMKALFGASMDHLCDREHEEPSV